jgi:hypothetical protein
LVKRGQEHEMAAEEFQGVLERIVRDDDFRAQVREDPEYLGTGFDLSPGEAGLLNALVEAAYGRSEQRATAPEPR